MDDVRQTIADVRNLNPTNSLRDAMNPLRQLGNDIRSDLQNAVTPPSGPATSAPVDAPAVTLSEPEMKLPDTPPAALDPAAAVTASDAAGPVVTGSTAADSSVADKPKRNRKTSTKSVQEIEAETVAAKPERSSRTIAAKADAKKPKVSSIAAMEAEPAITPALTEMAATAAKSKATKTVTPKKSGAVKQKVQAAKSDDIVAAPAVKKSRTVKAKKDEA